MDARTLRRLGFALGLLGVLVGLGGVALLTVAAEDPTYSAESTLAIDQVERVSAAEGPDIIDKLSRLRLKFSGLVGTRAVAGPVAEDLDRDEDEVAGALYSFLYPDSLLMAVGARHRDPDTAVLIARSGAEYLVELAEEEQEEAGVAPEDRYELTVVTPVQNAVQADQPRQRAGIVVLGLALILMLVPIPLRFAKSS